MRHVVYFGDVRHSAYGAINQMAEHKWHKPSLTTDHHDFVRVDDPTGDPMDVDPTTKPLNYTDIDKDTRP